MGGPLGIVNNILGLIALICYILVIVKMFQHGQTGLAVVCIIGLFCFIGYLVAFIYGWVKANDWKIQPVMLVWTVVFIINIALGGYIYSTAQPVVVVPNP